MTSNTATYIVVVWQNIASRGLGIMQYKGTIHVIAPDHSDIPLLISVMCVISRGISLSCDMTQYYSVTLTACYAPDVHVTSCDI